MADRPLYHSLTLEQVTEAVSRCVLDKRFEHEATSLRVIHLQAELLIRLLGLREISADDAETEKNKIATKLFYFAQRLGEDSIFNSYGITPVNRD